MILYKSCNFFNPKKTKLEKKIVKYLCIFSLNLTTEFRQCRYLLEKKKQIPKKIPHVVHDYKPQTGMFGDEDLNNTQQASCLMDEVSFDRCHQEEKGGLMNRVFTYTHFLF